MEREARGKEGRERLYLIAEGIGGGEDNEGKGE